MLDCVAIIGGTGLYQLDGLVIEEELEVSTPFGAPSAPIVAGRIGGNRVLFLPRHGNGHRILPHEVNYRANIWALKAAGAQALISVSATGSLREELPPGTLVLPDQYIDMAMGVRKKSFYGDGIVGHLSTAHTTSPALSALLYQAGLKMNVPIVKDGTYVCVEGPRLGTRAESFFWRTAGAHLVGMTQVPEVFLAKEAGLAQATVAVVTDYDCWKDEADDHVTVDAVMAQYAKSIVHVRDTLFEVLSAPLDVPPGPNPRSAIMTAEEHWTPEQARMLAVLLA